MSMDIIRKRNAI